MNSKIRLAKLKSKNMKYKKTKTFLMNTIS